jgi:hypothetical protein
MANVKVFADRQTDRQTNKRTGQEHAPDLSIWGHKKNNQYRLHFVTTSAILKIEIAPLLPILAPFLRNQSREYTSTY